MRKLRGDSHYQLKLKAKEFLQGLGYYVQEECRLGRTSNYLDSSNRVDVFGVGVGGSTAVVECGTFPYERKIKFFRDGKIDRLYWWKFDKPEPFVLRLCNSCLESCDFLNHEYLICSTLPRRKCIIGRFREPCPIMRVTEILDSARLYISRKEEAKEKLYTEKFLVKEHLGGN